MWVQVWVQVWVLGHGSLEGLDAPSLEAGLSQTCWVTGWLETPSTAAHLG